MVVSTRDREQGRDRAAHLVDQADHPIQPCPGVRVPLGHQGQLDLAADAGERGAQLVGQLGGQPLLAAQGAGDPVEEQVEGVAEVGDLVRRCRVVEPRVEVASRSSPPPGWPSTSTGAERAIHRPGRDARRRRRSPAGPSRPARPGSPCGCPRTAPGSARRPAPPARVGSADGDRPGQEDAPARGHRRRLGHGAQVVDDRLHATPGIGAEHLRCRRRRTARCCPRPSRRGVSSATFGPRGSSLIPSEPRTNRSRRLVSTLPRVTALRARIAGADHRRPSPAA